MVGKSKPALFTLALIGTLALTLAIGVLTLTPVAGTAVPGSDKLHHYLAFLALALPLSFARPRLALWIAVGVVAYGGAIELIQPLVGRGRELADFLADAAGAVSGAALGVALHWLRRRLD
jgi:VanZ family protein